MYHVSPPKLESLSGEELKKISDVKYLISQLYDALNIQDFHVQKEVQLVKVKYLGELHFCDIFIFLYSFFLLGWIT